MMRYDADGVSPEKIDAIERFGAYMQALVEERRSSPRDDMVSDLLAAEFERQDGSRRTVRGPLHVPISL